MFLGDVNVLKHTELTSDSYQLLVERPSQLAGIDIRPGQFFMLSAADHLLKRPVSVSGIASNYIEFTIQKVGQGTRCIENLSTLKLMGPLGNGVEIKNHKRVLVVGGGIGTAPLKAVCEQLAHTEAIIDVILGFREKPIYEEEFQGVANSLSIQTDLKTKYRQGRVTEVLQERMAQKTYDMIYACGPRAMLKHVSQIANEKDVPAQVLMEEKMACGIGACLVCTCKIKTGDFTDVHKRVCKEGPMFWASEVIFDEV